MFNLLSKLLFLLLFVLIVYLHLTPGKKVANIHYVRVYYTGEFIRNT